MSAFSDRVALASSCQRTRGRPLPSTQILMSMANETKTNGNISGSSSTTGPSSLLKKFYESVGKKEDIPVVNKNKNTIPNDSEQETPTIDEINDPSFSTIKIGHHRRYLQLTKNTQEQKQSSQPRHLQKRELKKLQSMIVKEQASYRLALDKFHYRYKSRYLVGFESRFSNGRSIVNANANRNVDGFSRWACSHAESINREWKKALAASSNNTTPSSSDQMSNECYSHALPRCYGKVRQTLALHPRAHRSSLDVQDLTCSVVYESKPLLRPTSSSMTRTTEIPEFSPNETDHNTCQAIPPPTIESAPAVQLLRNDPKALELAAQYSANIITTSETLETLLRRPGDYSCNWMLPCTSVTVPDPKSKSKPSVSSSIQITILDFPIAHGFSSPRACLERGLQEGLYQLFQQTQQRANRTTTSETIIENSKEQEDGSSVGERLSSLPAIQYVYSLWTLPGNKIGGNISKKPIKVIVRTLVRLKDSASKLPVRMRARVEYFASPVNLNYDEIREAVTSRAHREIPNSYEKSLWILDQVLFGHQAFCLQYRIDPVTCKILGWDTTSIAHAFAESSANGGSNRSLNPQCDGIGPLDHWKGLIQLLQSIPAIDVPETLLCLPGLVGERGRSEISTNGKTLLGQGSHISSNEQKDGLQTQQQQEQDVRLDPFSVSVHAACKDILARTTSEARHGSNSLLLKASSSSNATIFLDETILGRAGTVRLGQNALVECRRDWEWDRPGQVPNTFPVIESISPMPKSN
ncbi:unnamed protein product [Pseudo-nitzschia multistriata]|uniref:Uncharacterized protein n=1 Tax=Pseudo-nitzschia multistriata TaxID=183589 RepID=A0A448YUS8_9STRA|nr:unnamed protein product [Pseudo-nitzschia multistriata]